MFATPPTPPPAIPAPVIREEVRYYSIEGRNEPALVAQMNAKGHLSRHGRYWGYTSPKLKWSFGAKSIGGRCHLVDPKVELTITTTLPRWTPPSGTSAAMLAKWRAFDQAMHHHEGEHAQIARDEAQALVALMRQHPDDASCSALDTSLQAEGTEIMRKAEAANVDLDNARGTARPRVWR